MGSRMKPILGAWITAVVIVESAVRYVFNPQMPAPAFEPVLAGLAGTLVFWLVMVLFFDWAVQRSGRTMHTALVIAISQILLVDFRYVLIGRREMAPALTSAVILMVAWFVIGKVYGKLSTSS